MAEVRYVPATGAEPWRVAAAPGALVALPPNVSIPTIDAVWRRLGERGIGAVIEALTGAFGTSLAAIPDFVLVIVEGDGLRVAVRGPIELVVETEAGPVSVSGTGVSTWAERLVPTAQRASALFVGAADEAASLPLVDGVVPADAVSLDVSGARAGFRAPAVAVAAAPVAPEPEPAPEPQPEPAPQPEPVAEPEPVAQPDPDPEPEPDSETVAPDAEAAASEDQVMIWGETIVRPTAAPVIEPPDEATLVSGGTPVAGDHDGETIAVADIRSARRGESPVYESTEIVPARRIARGRIRISDGQVVELDNTVIVGRRPRSSRSTGDTLPTLVAVDSPDQDISRNHVEIRAEGEHVLVVDLDTTNGSVLMRGGNDPVRLHPSEPTMVVTGDVLDIGDGVTITFEDLP
ncbi:FHA domain-containing protein [Microbacterium thalli]|uniref:FHA domain-containing protein n=1 Tax=Microbacterium thalli TaxID=3027921 RepID=UPI00236624B7|nr:FHA domain-containing protein [Microbacterium thalli]MDD7928499.1 FHA domain-containing protein [Microbacterium thalli]